METKPYVILDTVTLLKKFPVIHPTPRGHGYGEENPEPAALWI